VTAPTPLDHDAWRRSLLGRITEAVERAAAFLALEATKPGGRA
jgi:hypothetical protein